MERFNTFMNWSTGKDAALALHYLLKDPSFNVKRLLTSMNAHHNRVSMHGVHRDLLALQAEATGIPHSTIELPEMPDMHAYESAMKSAVEELKAEGLCHAAFGDIFLEDLRAYREQQLASQGIQAHFPLWKKNTRDLAEELIGLGFKAIVVCVNAELLDASFAGRIFDHDFIRDLPPGVDPCGENGEFHTFCYHAPYFRHPVKIIPGEKIFRSYQSRGDESKTSGFWFCELLPGT